MISSRVGRCFGLIAVMVVVGCASGGDTGPGGGGGMDGGGSDAGSGDAGGGDTGDLDAGTPDGGADAGPGSGLDCESCASDEDCTQDYHCVALEAAGGRICLRECVRDLPDCPARFDCVDSLTAGVPEPLCAPVGERCCVDADADEHGTGVGCDGADCDDADATIHADAVEACNG